ncbi:MAG: rRNA synthase [Clostridiales bacterium]|nr:rRNA synthase [Clostridiales bacterium]MDK2933119.1 rRNA synthase [Clostridiales bacterium]
MTRVFELTVTKEMCGKSIKQILYNYYQMSTRTVNKLKMNKGIYLNGTHKYITTLVQEGDILKIVMPIEKSDNIIPTPMTLDIIYEDSDLMVINKMPNLPVHPSQGNYYHTLANGVMYYWERKGCNYMYRPVNRLDKDTSGLMIIAKNQYVHQQLSKQISKKELKRKYIAVVHGIIRKNKGTIDLPIARKEGSTIERVVSEEGQYAITHYSVLKRINHFTMLELTLETGRTHQIRVHMSHIGHPLVGDWLYGNEEQHVITRQALHSYYLEFFHPVTKQQINFESEIPEDMKRLLNSTKN